MSCAKNFLAMLAIGMVVSLGTPTGRTEEQPEHNAAADKIVGYYVGQFGPNKITLRVEKIVGATVLGYSVVAGNQRAFSGSFKESGGVLEVVAREPGDDKNDGEFRFAVNPDQANSVTGAWTEYKTKRKVTFELARRTFKYDPKAGKYPQSSTRLLTEADVENRKPEELRIMRNEIYARHGYSFKLKDMRSYFDAQPWYMPMSSNVSSQLTKVEEKNQELIKRYEQYGDEYYDAFGR